MLSKKLSRKSLGVLIVTGLCVLVITGTVMGAFDSGTDYDVEWHVQVSSLAYNSDTEWTDSYHQYYIQNNGNLHIKYTYEFSHLVEQILGDGTKRRVGDDVIELTKPAGADTLDNGEDDLKWSWNGIPMSDEPPGMYRITAYTQLRVKKVEGGLTTHLFSTPDDVKEVDDFDLMDMDPDPN